MLLERLAKFTLTSGLGLGLDFGVFAALTALGFPPGPVNMFSAACGVTFVYFASVYRVFSYQGRHLISLLVIYLGYQALAVTAASWSVAEISKWAPPLLAKLAILPITFSANFAVMHLITRSRSQAVAQLEDNDAHE